MDDNQGYERGPNYNWQHEAEHYKEEANDLRKLLRLIEQSNDKYANEADSLRLLAESHNELATKYRTALEKINQHCPSLGWDMLDIARAALGAKK